MKMLFIGGTGLISTAATALAAGRGIDLCLLNRGRTPADLPDGVRVIHADIRNREQATEALKDHRWDAVVDWVGFVPEHVETDLALFRDCADHYIFISTVCAYQKPPSHWRITESTPLSNPFVPYAQNKIACEERLMRAYREEGFPVTIVRPGHTYGPPVIPAAICGWDFTVPQRMREGRKVLLHGDGSSLWVLTHRRDFAKGLVGLLGNARAIGHAFHVTSDEALTWTQIYEAIGRAAGAAPRIVCVPSKFIQAFDPGMATHLVGEFAYSHVFDNSKIKEFVPGYQATTLFEDGIRECIAYFDADPARRKVNEEGARMMERIIAAYESAMAEGGGT
jgi:nucleoside-diphosphate-sugar epimerase